MRSARPTGFSSNISLMASTENPLSYQASISSLIRPSRRSIGMPECRLLSRVSEINVSNSARENTAVGVSSAKPLLTNSIHSLSNIERCLAPLLARLSTKSPVSSRRSLSRSNSRKIATLLSISSSPSIEASKAISASIRVEAALYFSSSRLSQAIALLGSSASLVLQLSIAKPRSSHALIICIPSNSNSRHSWSNESTRSMNSSVSSRRPAIVEL